MSKGDAVELLCPECKKIVSCNVTKTFADHSAYKFRSFFESFTKLDGNFRKRIRVCTDCGGSFNTVEIDEIFLNDLRGKIDFTNKSVEDLDSHLRIMSNTIGSLKGNVDKSTGNENREKIGFYIDFVFSILGETASRLLIGKRSKIIEYYVKNDPKDFFEVLDNAMELLNFKEKQFLGMKYGIGNAKPKRSRSAMRKVLSFDDKEIDKYELKIVEKLVSSDHSENIYLFLKGLGLAK